MKSDDGHDRYVFGYVFWTIVIFILATISILFFYNEIISKKLIANPDNDISAEFLIFETSLFIFGVLSNLLSLLIFLFGIKASLTQKCPVFGLPMPFRVKSVYGKEAIIYGVFLIILGLGCMYLSVSIFWLDYGTAI